MPTMKYELKQQKCATCMFFLKDPKNTQALGRCLNSEVPGNDRHTYPAEGMACTYYEIDTE